MNSMKLYHCKDARSFRPLWALEELTQTYELISLPFPPRIKAPEYLEVNALGTVPTFMDGPVVMTESSAICHYLAEKCLPNNLRIDPTEPDYPLYLNWLYRSDATLTFPLTIVLRYSSLEPEGRKIPQAVEDYTIWFLSRLRSVESALQGRTYLCGDRFTMADIAVHFALYLGDALGLRSKYKKNCARYLDELMQRSAFQRAIHRQYDDSYDLSGI